MQIGNIVIQHPVLLAPMAGVTDSTFRKLCSEQGAGLVTTEMISAKGLFYQDKGTKGLMPASDEKHPIAVQLFGKEPSLLGEVAKMVSEEADLIDINMGCPVPKVVKNGEGSHLLLFPQLVGKIVKTVVENAAVPVTVKIRKGWDEQHCNAVEIAKIVEENGASAITVHGRTRDQFYAGSADWECIRQVKEAVKIPVIGNGDVTSGELAQKMLEQTHCDAVMVGRGALGNPWIFAQMNAYLEKKEVLPKPTITTIQQMILKHLSMLVAEKGEYTAVREMRKHVAWYVKGMHRAAEIRNAVNQMESCEAIEALVKKMGS